MTELRSLQEPDLVVLHQLFAAATHDASAAMCRWTNGLITLTLDEVREIPHTWELITFHTSSGSTTIPTATIRLKYRDGTVTEEAACGDGPVDAIYKTLERITGISGKLEEYEIRAVTRGKDAMGEVSLAVNMGGRTVRGRAVSTDIIEASAKAYLHAINSTLFEKASKQKRRGKSKK